MFSGFSWEPVYRLYHFARRLCVLSGSASVAYFTTADLPTPFNGLFRQPAAVSLLRPRFTHTPSNGMFTVSAIRSASRLPVRSRLTLIRLALIRNPWSFGEGFLAPFIVTYTYICFSQISSVSHGTHSTTWECSPTDLPLRQVPQLRYRTYARLLSTQSRSTSELLRTL